MLQTFQVPAGGRQIDTKATFFRYESSGSNGIDETIRVRADGNDLGTYLPGDSIDLPIHAKRWEVVPVSGSQTCIVRLGVGRIDTARLVGVVSVTNKIGSSVQNVFGNGATALGFTVLQIVAPASNPRGMLMRRVSCSLTGVAGSTYSEARIIAAPAAPASNLPANSYQIAYCSVVGAVSGADVRNDQNNFLPPTWGIWIASTINGAAASASSYEMNIEFA